jgi:hypothetical protein
MAATKLYGTVVRATPAISSGPDIGAKPYMARYANGSFAGMFASARLAQQKVEQSASQELVWIDETRNGIEAYKGLGK